MHIAAMKMLRPGMKEYEVASVSYTHLVDVLSLYREVNSSTQTRKSTFERWENVEKVFALHPSCDSVSYTHLDVYKRQP